MKYESFEYTEHLPGVFHIRDEMGVCMTLLTGAKRALLIDTGYGTDDVKKIVSHLTELPYDVILTHCHHDHALGARCFEKTFMFPQDIEDFELFTGAYQKSRVLAQAEAKGLKPDRQAFLDSVIPAPLPLCAGDRDLDGLTASLIHCPGHTPGSCMVYVKELKLLLTGDNWNPCTWLFFESAVPVTEYRKNLSAAVKPLDIAHVLCPHQPFLYGYDMLEEFISNLTDDRLSAARKVDISPYEAIDTRQLDMPSGQFIVFDYKKFKAGKDS